MADTKAAWTFSALGVAAAALTNKLIKTDWSSIPKTQGMLFLGIAIILFVASFKELVGVIFPRLSKGNTSGTTYFKDILTQSPQSYTQKIEKYTDKEITAALSSQAHTLSTIADKKYKLLRLAMISSLLTIIWTIFLLVVL